MCDTSGSIQLSEEQKSALAFLNRGQAGNTGNNRWETAFVVIWSHATQLSEVPLSDLLNILLSGCVLNKAEGVLGEGKGRWGRGRPKAHLPFAFIVFSALFRMLFHCGNNFDVGVKLHTNAYSCTITMDWEGRSGSSAILALFILWRALVAAGS